MYCKEFNIVDLIYNSDGVDEIMEHLELMFTDIQDILSSSNDIEVDIYDDGSFLLLTEDYDIAQDFGFKPRD